MPRVILIDAENQEVKDVEIEKLNFKNYYPLVKTDILERGIVDEPYMDDHSLYIDEEGMLKEPKYFFLIEGAYQPFAGNGIISGVDKAGREKEPKLFAVDIESKITFRQRF